MVTTFKVSKLQFSSYKAYLWSAAFVLGNLLLPQLCHLTPYGGNILLPIYFFTLIAAYKFGWQIGLVTAVLSPVVNSLLFGMPTVSVLPFILIKSVLLASMAALVASKSNRVSILHILLVVLSYQIMGTAIESLILWSNVGWIDFQMGIPGMLIQVFAGYFLLRTLAKL